MTYNVFGGTLNPIVLYSTTGPKIPVLFEVRPSQKIDL